MLGRLKERASAYRKSLVALSLDHESVQSFEEVALTKGEVQTVVAAISELSRKTLGGDPPEHLWQPMDVYAKQNYDSKKEWADNEAEYFRWFLMGIEKTQIFLDYLEGFQDSDLAQITPRPAISSPGLQEVLGNLQSVFISYGGPDERFATKLNDALKRVGVHTFFFPDDAPPGAKLHRVMREGVNQFERIVLICSRNSLDRPGVANEIEESLQREAREGGRAVLMPVAIDDYVFGEWTPNNADVALALRDRVIADFRNTKEDPAAFERALGRVVAALVRTRQPHSSTTE
jgi:hypothetical protein